MLVVMVAIVGVCPNPKRCRLNGCLLPDRLRGGQVHSKKVRMRDTSGLGELARSTAGFSGAELANVINEAAMLAARWGCLRRVIVVVFGLKLTLYYVGLDCTQRGKSVVVTT